MKNINTMTIKKIYMGACVLGNIFDDLVPQFDVSFS